MLIGTDFEKIQWSPFGLDLVEPNAFIGDTFLLCVALFFAYKTHKLGVKTAFFRCWSVFFVVFGIGFFLGGLGHSLYNYTGLVGKYPSWYIGIISMYFLESAMISIFPNEKVLSILKVISKIKLVLALIGATLVFYFVDINEDPSIGLKVPSLNSLLGLVGSLGVLGAYYMKLYSTSFKYHILSLATLLPAALAQSFKINFYPWFDRNDISHICLAISIYLYFLAIKGYATSLTKN